MGCHFLLQGDLPNPGIELGSSTLQADSLPCEPLGKLSILQAPKDTMNRFVKTISTSFKYFLKNKIWTDSLQKHTVLFTWKVWSQPPTCTLFTKTLGTVLWLVISDRTSWTPAPSSKE